MDRTNRYLVILLLGIFFILPKSVFSISNGHNLPREGFHEGPYIFLQGGLIQFDWDVNERTGVEEGHPYEPFVGLGFGWNVFDWLAPEVAMRYTTTANNGRREHIAAANTGAVLTALINPLLDFEHWRILPFIKPGFSFQIAILPGDTLSNDKRISSKGIGPSVGGGVRFTYKKYLYFGILAQEEFLYHEGQTQTLTPGGNRLIYQGGWKPHFAVSTMIGVHF